MGVTIPEAAWERRARLIGPRNCRALRAALDVSIGDLARMAGLSVEMVMRVEWLGPGLGVDMTVPAARRAVSDAFEAIGGEWCAPDPHKGAHSIHLVGRAADDRHAVKAALALLPATIERLSRRVRQRAGIREPDLSRALLNRNFPLSPLMAKECFHQLEKVAGCYFEPATGGGWCVIGCDPAGWPK